MKLSEFVKAEYGKSISECTNEELYYALLTLTKKMASGKQHGNSKKKLYYISAEFLIGKLLSNNLINLGIYDEVKEELAQNGKDICEIEEFENEPSLGNGGLGRLAACFIDSIATLGLNGDGVGGAAAATVLSQIVSVVLTAYFLVKSDFLEEKIGIRTMKICKEHMGMMVKKGFPLALQSMLFPIANSIVQASVNTMGTDSIAAWGICDKLDLLIWLIADSMVPVLTTYTAQNLGAGKTKRVKKGALIGTGLSVIAVGIISLVLYFGSGLIGPLFIDQKDVPTLIPLVVRYMQMMAPFFVFYAVAEALSGACCGLGETLVPMITTLLTICLFRVVCILLVLPSFKTMECIVWIYIGSWVVSGVAFAVLYLAKVRKLYHKKIK